MQINRKRGSSSRLGLDDNFVSDFIILPEQSGSGVSEHQTPPGLRDLLLRHVEAERSTPAAELLLPVRTLHRDDAVVVLRPDGLGLQHVDPDIPQTLLTVDKA